MYLCTEEERLRAAECKKLNDEATERAALTARYGQVWNAAELQRDFQVTAFMAPYVGVVRRADNVSGTLMFQHSPRFYFSFQEA